MAKKITFDPAHRETDRILAKLEKKLKNTYSEAYGNAVEKFTSYMAAFQRKDESHKADVASGAWTQEQYESWRKNQLLYGDTLKGIRDTIAADLHNTNKIAINLVRDKQKDIYALNHNYGTYEVEKGAGVSTSYTLYDHDTVERLMREDPELLPPPSKKRQKEIDAKDLRWNKQKLTSAFTASILSGDSIPRMAGRIASVAQMDRNAAIRNARTMSTGAENAGRTDSYKRAVGMGINIEQEWMATLDGRTRDSHRELDGEKIKVGKKFSNGLRFPADPDGPASEVYNCRCTLVAVVDGVDPAAFDKNDTLQRVFGNEELTYTEWKYQHAAKADFLMTKVAGTSNEEEFDNYKVAMKACGRIPYKAQLAVGNYTVEAGNNGSSCYREKKKILMSKHSTEREFYHEFGHLLEYYAVDKKKLKAYKEKLVKGLGFDDIVSSTYETTEGKKKKIFLLKNGNFESEYQSRLYGDYLYQILNADGTINTDCMLECVSVPFEKYMMGEPISEDALDLFKEFL